MHFGFKTNYAQIMALWQQRVTIISSLGGSVWLEIALLCANKRLYVRETTLIIGIISFIYPAYSPIPGKQ